MDEIIEITEEAVEKPQQNPIIEWAAGRPFWEKCHHLKRLNKQANVRY